MSLRDGRRIAIASVGPVDGVLVLYLHGAIGSPQGGSDEFEAVVEELGVRYVTISRPGFGGSDPLPGRTLLDFAGDAGAVADALGRERFAVAGVSAGGPYALACAHELPHRVAAAAVVSSMPWGRAPDEVAGLTLPARSALRLLRRRPRSCTRSADVLLAIARRHPRLVSWGMQAAAAPADRRLLRELHARDDTAARFIEAAAGGVGPMIDDYLLCAGAWGFEPRDVRGLVHLWHGSHDTLVPVDEALALAAALPRVRVALDSQEGHFFYRRRLRDILGELAGAVRGSRAGAAAPSPRRGDVRAA